MSQIAPIVQYIVYINTVHTKGGGEGSSSAPPVTLTVHP